MESGNRTHGSGSSPVRSQVVLSRRDTRQGGSHQLAVRGLKRNVESRDRRSPTGAVRLAREGQMGRDQATLATPAPERVRHLVEPSAAGRGVIQEDRELLAKCSLFRELAADERAALIAHARIRKCAAEETIFRIGSPGDSMMAVLSGHVRISVASPHGKQMVLAILVAGEIFGEIALLDGKERTADARAATECRLAILDRRDVLAFFDQHPNAWPRLAEALCGRLRQTDRQITEMALMGLPIRLAKALLRMTAIEPHAPNNRLSDLRLSQSEIGSLVGATRESVNKWLCAWQRKGIVRIAKSLITIADRHALKELAQFEPEANQDHLSDPHRQLSVKPGLV